MPELNIMEKAYTTTNSKQTQKLGEMLARELQGGEIICLTGELGSGKTTFAQGILRGLGAKGPYTSPTFVVLKHYKIMNYARPLQVAKRVGRELRIRNVYHIDAYRVGAKDILDLGWREIISHKNNVIIVEWAEKIQKIIPKGAVWVRFKHKGRNERELLFK